jgi:hypothetical protein
MAITNSYLKNPDQFPSPGGSRACGEHVLYIDFAGGPYKICGLNDHQLSQLREHFSEVCSSKPVIACEPVCIHIFKIPPARFQLPDPPPEYRTFELDAQEKQVNVAGENMCATIDLSGPVTGYLWTIEFEKYFHSNTFENFFRLLVTYRLLNSGGMLLHSAGIVNDDSACLFPGRSEDGKSTLSRLSIDEGRTVLSDDMNAVTWRGSEPWVEKVPFTGDLRTSWSRGSSYPLSGIFAIRKADTTSVRGLSAPRALALLTSCTPYINADPYRLPLLLANLYKLMEQVPVKQLNFSLSGKIWPVIENAIGRDSSHEPGKSFHTSGSQPMYSGIQ